MSDLTAALKIIGIVVSSICLAACEPDAPTNKDVQSHKAADALKNVTFDENAEIDNIARRLKLTADPGKIGFILLLNQASQPIMYEGVKGKVTSGGKRLTSPDRAGSWGSGQNNVVRAAASDEGTWGTSAPYIFYWNTDGVYRQWDGGYLYSDQPIRTRVEPLIISVQSASK